MLREAVLSDAEEQGGNRFTERDLEPASSASRERFLAVLNDHLRINTAKAPADDVPAPYTSHKRRWMLTLLIALISAAATLILTFFVVSYVTNNRPRKVVRLMIPVSIYDQEYEIQTHYPEEGDFRLSARMKDEYTHQFPLYLHWGENECSITFEMDPEYQEHVDFYIPDVTLTFGEPMKYYYPSIPQQVCMYCYYCKEDDPLPDEWIEVQKNANRIKMARKQYGSFDVFSASRDQKTEKEIINQGAIDSGITGLDINDYYDCFLRALWANGDTEVKLRKATIRTEPYESHPGYEIYWLVLNCDDGCVYEVLGHLVVTKDGNLYFGPTE